MNVDGDEETWRWRKRFFHCFLGFRPRDGTMEMLECQFLSIITLKDYICPNIPAGIIKDLLFSINLAISFIKFSFPMLPLSL